MAYQKIRTNSKVFKSQVQEHILNNLSEDYHDSDHVADRLADVWSDFNSWYGPHEQKHHHNKQEAFTHWLDGLPSCLNTEFESYNVHQTMKSFFEDAGGSYNKSKPDDKEYKLYKNLIYMNLLDLSKKYNVHP